MRATGLSALFVVCLTPSATAMNRRRKAQLRKQAQRARAGKALIRHSGIQRDSPPPPEAPGNEEILPAAAPSVCTLESDSDDEDVFELTGDELLRSLEQEVRLEIRFDTLYQKLAQPKAGNEWQVAEQDKARSFAGYTGNSRRNVRHLAQKAREKAQKDEISRGTYVASH